MKTEKLTILAIDDHQDNLITLKAILTDALPNAVLLTALNGPQGLATARSENPDVILLDIAMPEMDGFDVCKRLKADKDLCDIPVVFITAGSSDRQHRMLALDCGAEAFLAKPIDESELTAQILAMLKIKTAIIEKRTENERLAIQIEKQTLELKKAHAITSALLETLKQEKEFFERMFNTSPDAALVTRMSDGRIVDVNEGFVKLSGYTRTEAMGNNSQDMDLYGSLEDRDKILGELDEKGHCDSVEAVFRCKDGHLLIGLISAGIVSLNGAQYVSISIRDITERKEMEEQLRQSEERFQTLFYNAPLGYQSLDIDGRFLEVNQQWLDTLGYTRQEVIGKWFGDFVSPEYLEGFRQRFPLFKAQGRIHSEFEMKHKDENKVFIAFDGKIGYEPDGNFKQTHCILQDITEKKRLEIELRETHSLINAIMRSTTDNIFVKDLQGRYKLFNEAAERATGKSAAEVLDKDDCFLFSPDEAKAVMEGDAAILESGETCTYEESVTNISGKAVTYLSTKGPLYDENYNLIGLFGISRDITDRKIAEENLVHLSFHDYLTGLYNRRFFEEELKRLDTKRNLPMTVAMGDVNGLKLINDSFGHAVGDELLKKVAEVMRKSCRSDDIIARLGGDEFGIFLPRTDAAGTERIMQRIRELLSREKSGSMDISISFGYETKLLEGESIQDIVRNAEDQMYRHKLHESSSMRSKTIDLVMNTLFEKSSREMMHSGRVGELCESIALELYLEPDEVQGLKTAGLMHDIGKIGISDQILNKPQKLSSDEWSEVKKHPDIGFRILSSVSEFSEIAQDVLEHHERWDGKGYPKGLAGEQIRMHARVLAIADAYDAMTSYRTYGTALSENDAIEEIKRCSGFQFDPEIAQVFVEKVLKKPWK